MAARTKSGTSYEARQLDAIEQRFWGDAWEAVAAPAAREQEIARASFGPVQATVIGALAEVQMTNLLLGATEPGAVADGHLEAALAWTRERGVDPYVPVTPGLPDTAVAEETLRAAGLAPSYGWMKFVRDAHPPRFTPPADVEVLELTAPGAEPFAAIVAAGFRLPAWGAELFANLPGRPGWRCYVAKVDGNAQAAAAMFLDPDPGAGIAEFGMAATLEPARRRGCQAALLHRRIVDAAAAGCELLFVETGERIPGRPSNSYRNILRAGFQEAYVCPNWGAPAPETVP